jgi:hypothetical protein
MSKLLIDIIDVEGEPNVIEEIIDKKPMEEPNEEVRCGDCDAIMWYNEDNGVHNCTNPECIRCDENI